jgi:hypothetical protein
VKAVYRNGVLHPEEPPSLKDGETVDVAAMPVLPGAAATHRYGGLPRPVFGSEF